MAESHNPSQESAPAAAEDLGFRDRRLPGTPAGEARGMLPGMALIGVYMLLVAMVGGFGAIHGRYPGGRYVILTVCTLIVVGVFGFLRLRRWGWALIIGGCLCMCLWYIYMSHLIHNPGLLIMAGLDLCFFLYLSRTEVRERLR